MKAEERAEATRARHTVVRERIKAAAWTLLREKGPSGVGVLDVAKLAGMSKPAIYYYYKTSTDIVAGLVEDVLNGELDTVETAEQASQIGEWTGPPITELLPIVMARVDYYVSDPWGFFVLNVWARYLNLADSEESQRARAKLAAIKKKSMEHEPLIGVLWDLADGVLCGSGAGDEIKTRFSTTLEALRKGMR